MLSTGGAFKAGSIVAALTLDKTGWNNSVRSVQKDEKTLGGVTKKIGMNFAAVGKAMTLAGGVIVGVLSGAVKAFADFNQAMTESTAIMGNVSDAMKLKMAEAAKEMSTRSTFAAKELAKSYYYLASAGLDAEQSIAALPVVTKFAQAGAFDLARATDLLTDAQSALGLTVKDAAENQENMVRVSDVLVKANTLANASVQQFSEALTNRAGPAMRAYGIELESGVAVLAAFADQGVKGSEAGTLYSMVLRDLQRAALLNRSAFEAAGIAVYDAGGNMSNMGDIMAQLEARLGTMTAEQRKAELSVLGFQERSQAAMLTLIGTSGKIKEYEENIRKAGGVTDEVAEKQLKSLSSQLKLAKNNITNAAISLGEQLAPTIVKVSQEVAKIIKKIQEWINEHPRLFNVLVKVTGAVGVLGVTLGPLLIMLPSLAAGFTMLSGAIASLWVALAPLAPAILAVGAAFAGWKLGRWIGEVTGLDNAYQKFFGGLIEKLGLFKSKAVEADLTIERLAKRELFLAEASRIAGRDVTNLMEATKILKAEFLETGTVGNQALDDWLSNIPSLKKPIKEITDEISGLGDAAEDIASIFREFGVKTKTELTEELKHAEESLAALRTSAERTPEAIKVLTDTVQDLRDQLYGFSRTTISDTFVPACEDTRSILSRLDESIVGKIIPAVKDMRDVLAQVPDTLRDWAFPVTSAFDKLAEKAQETMRKIQSVTSQAFGTLNSIISQSQRNREIEIENEYKTRLDFINANITDEEERQNAIQALEAEYQIKRTAARRKAAKADKAVALMQAIVNTASAVAEALPNIFLAALVGAMGAVQIATIAAQPIPLAKGAAFEEPTIVQNALVGEAGPEYLLPEKKLIEIVQKAQEVPPPSLTTRTQNTQSTSSTSNLTVQLNSPLITTLGLSRQEIRDRASELWDAIQFEARRRGYALNGS